MKIISLSSLHTKYLFKYYDVVAFFLFFSLALSYCVFALHSDLFIFLKMSIINYRNQYIRMSIEHYELSFNNLFCIVS